MLSGLIGRKIGITQVFTEGGTVEAVTAIEAGPCTVTQIKSVDKEGYNAIQLGFGEAKRLNAPEQGHLGKLGLFKHLREFRVEDTADIELGHRVDVSLFQPGDLVDVVGVSKGKGFAGVMKRHGFKGLPASHGTERKHRSPGGIGGSANAGTGRGVKKGKKMAGRMGNARLTSKNHAVLAL